MKRLFLISALILSFILCSYIRDVIADNKVVISGTIKNAIFDQIKIGDYQAKLDKEGNFELNFQVKEADYHTLWHGKTMPLFLAPGDRLVLTLDRKDFYNTIKFSGTGADVNNFLVNMHLLIQEHKKQVNEKDLFSLPEKDFVAKVNSLEAIFQEALDTFLSSNEDINKKFAKFEQARILYSWANFKLHYQKKHKQFTQEKAIKLSENYNNYLSKLDFNDPNLMTLQTYAPFYLDTFL